MRLLDVHTLKLVEFFDDSIPKYAILSHRWQAATEEVSFADIQNGQAEQRAAYSKLENTCRLAREMSLSYVWIDTCCIDKTSSAELSEAINSMFRYYLESEVCFAYLFDVDSSLLGNPDFPASSWFTRCWTLQELIAPCKIEFFDQNWRSFGQRNSPMLMETTAAITGIGIDLLGSQKSIQTQLREYSIAVKMSWASRRVATRREDVAYSLLGIFEVNMPLLYGEGDRAFIRLQEEIMKNSDDHTLFIWSSPFAGRRGLLARSPKDFADIGDVGETDWPRAHRAPYNFTNMGLSIELNMLPWAMNVYLARLNTHKGHRQCNIFLEKLGIGEQYARIKFGEDVFLGIGGNANHQCQVFQVFVRQQVRDNPNFMPMFYGFWIRTLPVLHQVCRVVTRNVWDQSQRLEIPAGERGTAGVIFFKSPDAGYSQLSLGFDYDFKTILYSIGPLWTGSLGDSVEVERMLRLSDENLLNPQWTTSKEIQKARTAGNALRYSIIEQRPMPFVNVVHRNTAKICTSMAELDGVLTRIIDIYDGDIVGDMGENDVKEQ